ncbi:hypothetical protein Tco_1362634 [Tanacetum coccineum]
MGPLLNKGLPHFCSPPLGGEQGKKKLINQLSPATYLHPGYGAASVLVKKEKLRACRKSQSGTLVRQGSACNRDLRIWVFLADFRWPAEVSSGSSSSVLLPLDRSQFGLGLVDGFACPASFPWHTAKHVIRDPAPVATDFNEQDYATLVAHPSLF